MEDLLEKMVEGAVPAIGLVLYVGLMIWSIWKLVKFKDVKPLVGAAILTVVLVGVGVVVNRIVESVDDDIICGCPPVIWDEDNSK